MEELVMEHGQNLLFSNFLLTISTNVVPINHQERVALAGWLRDEANNLFDDLAMLNGTVLKPADSPNEEKATFDDDNRIERIKSVVALEAGDQRGQMHMHVLVEVAHRYRDHTNAWGGRGVHVNVKALRDYLNGQIHLMQISPARRPGKIYVNSRLITSQANPSAKWLTLAYINKQRDNPTNGQQPRNLVNDRLAAPPEEQRIHAAMQQPAEEFTKQYDEGQPQIVMLPEPGGTAPGSPADSRGPSPVGSPENVREPMRFAPARRQSRRLIGEEQSTSSYSGGDLNPNYVWSTRRRRERREKK